MQQTQTQPYRFPIPLPAVKKQDRVRPPSVEFLKREFGWDDETCQRHIRQHNAIFRGR